MLAGMTWKPHRSIVWQVISIGWIGCCINIFGQTLIHDIFNRSLNDRGLTLVDHVGYMANPLIKFYVLPPDSAALPGTAMLTVNGERLYFDSPGNVSRSGPTKTISLTSSTGKVPVRLSIFPDRDTLDEDYSLEIVFTDAN